MTFFCIFNSILNAYPRFEKKCEKKEKKKKCEISGLKNAFWGKKNRQKLPNFRKKSVENLQNFEN